MKKDEYRLTVGLEIHAELATQTKMFCSCKNDPDEERPNINICPICLAHPGTLPVPNKEAIKKVLMVGEAIGGSTPEISEFDRKNYFYPDIPKGYQISQYKFPFVSGGRLAGVEITRVHLEEDTAKSTHLDDCSLVDFNRAGVPLMELVTEACIHTANDAANFARELQLMLQYLGVARANMEKGEMRVEANISVSKTDSLGTKVEVKNLNSIKAAQKAIEYEYKRQIELIESGGRVVQETRGWDDKNLKTFSQREKESSHDYRYFPDPDLPKTVTLNEADFSKESISSLVLETPTIKRNRFYDSYGIKDADVEFFIFNKKWSNLFERTAALTGEKAIYQLIANYIISDLVGMDNKYVYMDPQYLVDLMILVHKKDVSSRGAKDILMLYEEGKSPIDIAKSHNMLQVTDTEALKNIVAKVLGENDKAVAEYKSGKVASLQYLVGMCMKASRGSGNPEAFSKLLIEFLDS